jgi:iron(III) transport system permease protein
LGFIYVGALEYSGALPTFLRETLNLNLLNFINIKSVWGVAFVFSLALSPYVYLYVKSALDRMDERMVLSARSLGKTPLTIARNLIFPSVASWILSGAILVILEVLCDFGGVSVFNYETFSTAIYHAWESLFSLNTAVKLSIFPSILAIGLYLYNQWKFKIREKKERSRTAPVFTLKSSHQTLILLVILFYGFFSVFYPFFQLVSWSIEAISLEWGIDYFSLVSKTMGLGVTGSLFICFFSLLLCLGYRYSFRNSEKDLTVLTRIGYALPGSVVAIGMMSLFSLFGMNFYGTPALIALILGYTLKFFSVGFGLQNTAFQNIGQKMDWSSLSLGKSLKQGFFEAHLPILKPVLISSFVLIMIEIIKEIPITLILRPYGVDTLATRIYELTSEGEWERASLSAVVLVVFGGISIVLSERKEIKK